MKYFISYAWYSEKQSGFGNATIERDLPISEVSEITKISNDLMHNSIDIKMTHLIVLNIIKLPV